MVRNIPYRRIKDLREDRDLPQTAIAKLLGCSQRTVSNYEHGDVDIPTPYLEILADFYGTSVDYLLGRTDETRPYPKPTAAPAP